MGLVAPGSAGSARSSWLPQVDRRGQTLAAVPAVVVVVGVGDAMVVGVVGDWVVVVGSGVVVVVAVVVVGIGNVVVVVVVVVGSGDVVVVVEDVVAGLDV